MVSWKTVLFGSQTTSTSRIIFTRMDVQSLLCRKMEKRLFIVRRSSHCALDFLNYDPAQRGARQISNFVLFRLYLFGVDRDYGNCLLRKDRSWQQRLPTGNSRTGVGKFNGKYKFSVRCEICFGKCNALRYCTNTCVQIMYFDRVYIVACAGLRKLGPHFSTTCNLFPRY